MTLGQFLEYLFGVATGWLGWSPEVAWRSTVAEVTVAVRARIKWQNMINGGSAEETEDQKAAKVKAIFEARMNRG